MLPSRTPDTCSKSLGFGAPLPEANKKKRKNKPYVVKTCLSKKAEEKEGKNKNNKHTHVFERLFPLAPNPESFRLYEKSPPNPPLVQLALPKLQVGFPQTLSRVSRWIWAWGPGAFEGSYFGLPPPPLPQSRATHRFSSRRKNGMLASGTTKNSC